MAKKKANSFVLTIAGIAAATVIGVVGVNLTPAPHVIFSLAPSAEPQATAEPEPIGCVLAGTGQVVDFADPGAEEYVSLLDTDSQSLTERYALPALEAGTIRELCTIPEIPERSLSVCTLQDVAPSPAAEEFLRFWA